MTQFTEAAYTNGVLKPDEGLVLREAQRVRLIVEALDDDSGRGDRPAALQRLLAGIDGMRFFSRERLPSRDELHDHPWYEHPRQQVALNLISNAGDGTPLWRVACEFVTPLRNVRSQGFTAANAWNRLAE